jgi:hypothetical protein
MKPNLFPATEHTIKIISWKSDPITCILNEVPANRFGIKYVVGFMRQMSGMLNSLSRQILRIAA